MSQTSPADREPIDGMTANELKASYWYVNHQTQLRQILIAVLVLVNLGLWITTAYGAVRYFILDWAGERAYLAALTSPLPIDVTTWHAKHRPAPLTFSAVRVESLGNERYDLFVEVTNPNDAWTISELTYAFRWTGQGEALETSTFILPGQRKYLLALGVDAPTTPTGVKLEVRQQRWHRVNHYAALAADKLGLEVTSPEFIPAEKITGRTPVSKTRFVVTNNSPYSFWQVGFYIGIYQGSRLSALTYVVQTGIEALERRTIEVNWYQPLSQPTKIEVWPDVNILDPAVFRPVAITE